MFKSHGSESDAFHDKFHLISHNCLTKNKRAYV